jgi:hypothetical protein
MASNRQIKRQIQGTQIHDIKIYDLAHLLIYKFSSCVFEEA